MSKFHLDELTVPTPPYRAVRPVVKLAMADVNEKSDQKKVDDIVEQLQAGIKSSESSPEKKVEPSELLKQADELEQHVRSAQLPADAPPDKLEELHRIVAVVMEVIAMIRAVAGAAVDIKKSFSTPEVVVSKPETPAPAAPEVSSSERGKPYYEELLAKAIEANDIAAQEAARKNIALYSRPVSKPKTPVLNKDQQRTIEALTEEVREGGGLPMDERYGQRLWKDNNAARKPESTNKSKKSLVNVDGEMASTDEAEKLQEDIQKLIAEGWKLKNVGGDDVFYKDGPDGKEMTRRFKGTTKKSIENTSTSKPVEATVSTPDQVKKVGDIIKQGGRDVRITAIDAEGRVTGFDTDLEAPKPESVQEEPETDQADQDRASNEGMPEQGQKKEGAAYYEDLLKDEKDPNKRKKYQGLINQYKTGVGSPKSRKVRGGSPVKPLDMDDAAQEEARRTHELDEEKFGEAPVPPAPKSKTPEVPDFDVDLEKPPLHEAPKLDSLAKIQELIEFSRRTGRGPEFIRGLELERKKFAEAAEEKINLRRLAEVGPKRFNLDQEIDTQNRGLLEKEIAKLKTLETEAERLKKENAELRKKLAGGEQPPAPPQGPETPPAGGGAPENEPPAPGEVENAIRKIEDIENMGDDTGIEWSEREEMLDEATDENILAWWSGFWAKRAKGSLAKREKKVKELEKAAEVYQNKSNWGTFWSPVKYGLRINYHRWREGIVRGSFEQHDDSRARHENARNEILNMIASRIDTALKTHEARAEEYGKASKQLDAAMDKIDNDLQEIKTEIAHETDSAVKRQLIELRDELWNAHKKEAVRRKEYDKRWQQENAKAIELQRIKNHILQKAKPGSRPDTTPAPRPKIATRVKREPQKP